MSIPAQQPMIRVPAAVLAGAAVAASPLLGLLMLLPVPLGERIWLFVLLFPPLWALASSGLLLARELRGWWLAGGATLAGVLLVVFARLA